MEVKLFKSAFSVFNSVCVHDMMINNRRTSMIRRPPAPSPPSPLLPTRRSSGRPLDYALEASARVSLFEQYCHLMTRTSIWRGREESPRGHNIEKQRLGKEKGCAGMKESFSKWLKDSRFYVSVSRGGL